MSDPRTTAETRRLLSPRRLAMQLVGFAVGVALLGWIIANAVREGEWERILHADPLLLAALLGCTAVSTFLNGTAFWVVVQSIRRVRLWDMQRLNVVANMLNYAPVRIGAVARVLYHLRVDGLSLLQVGAWFGLIGYTLALGVASCAVATVARGRVDWVWAVLVLGQLALGGLTIRVLAGHALVARVARGLDRMVEDGRALWGSIGLRMIDLGMYTGRMAVAAAILEIDLPPAHIAVLALVALMASLIPFGRVGFREFCVAAAGQRLALFAGDVETSVYHMNQLALVESAGEALVLIPLGLLFVTWYRRRWGQGTWGRDAAGAG